MRSLEGNAEGEVQVRSHFRLDGKSCPFLLCRTPCSMRKYFKIRRVVSSHPSILSLCITPVHICWANVYAIQGGGSTRVTRSAELGVRTPWFLRPPGTICAAIPAGTVMRDAYRRAPMKLMDVSGHAEEVTA